MLIEQKQKALSGHEKSREKEHIQALARARKACEGEPTSRLQVPRPLIFLVKSHNVWWMLSHRIDTIYSTKSHGVSVFRSYSAQHQ